MRSKHPRSARRNRLEPRCNRCGGNWDQPRRRNPPDAGPDRCPCIGSVARAVWNVSGAVESGVVPANGCMAAVAVEGSLCGFARGGGTVIPSIPPQVAKWLRTKRCGIFTCEQYPCLPSCRALHPASIHMKKNATFIVATVPGFDPNRPDLQEFLNNLAAEALAEEPSAPRAPRRAKRPTRKARTAPSGTKRQR